MITGAIPFKNFKEQVLIVKRLQKEYSTKISLDIQDGIIFYEFRRTVSPDRFNEL